MPEEENSQINPGTGRSQAAFALSQKLLLLFIPLLAVAGIALPLALGQQSLAMLGSYLAVPMFFSALAYLMYRERFGSGHRQGNEQETVTRYENELDQETSGIREFGRRGFFLSLNLFLLNFIISLMFLRMTSVRPYAYYASVVAMAALILFNILFFKSEKRMSVIILLQIMALVLNIIWGVNLNYYFFIGRTDAIGHSWIIEDMLRQGRVTELFELYKPFPLWHILVSSVYSITGMHIPVHRAMFFTSGLIYALMIPLIYLISLKVFKNEKLSLLSALFTAVYSDVMFYGMYSISRSIVSFLEVLLILLLLIRGRPETAVLYIITIFSIIIFHTASMPFIICIFFILWVLQKLTGMEQRDLFLTGYCLLLMIVSTIFYWMFLAEDLFRAITSSIFSPPPVGVGVRFIDMPLNELFNYLQYSPMIFLALVGILFSLQSKIIPAKIKVLFLTGLLLMPVTFPGPSLLLSKLAASFNLARFSEYSFVIIILTCALGFGMLFFRSGKYSRSLLVLLFILMALLSLSNDFIASDNPLIKRPFYTFYLTDEEITGFYHISEKTKGYVMSDYVASNFIFNSPYMEKEHILEADLENMTILRNSSEDTVLIRTAELLKRPLYLYISKDGRLHLEPNLISSCEYCFRDIPLWRSLDRYNKVYESEQISGYN